MASLSSDSPDDDDEVEDVFIKTAFGKLPFVHKPHPCKTVLSSQMHRLKRAPVSESFPLFLPKVTLDAISGQQLETVTYMAIRHDTMAASENGYLLGDGTGSGKGRTIAASMIHQSYRSEYY